MKLLTKAQTTKMLKNGAARDAGESIDTKPVVKLFDIAGAGTWLLTELDPQDPDIAFGLCDLGMGCPELGSVRLSELTALRHPVFKALKRIERDIYWTADKTLTAYADEASAAGRIAA